MKSLFIWKSGFMQQCAFIENGQSCYKRIKTIGFCIFFQRGQDLIGADLGPIRLLQKIFPI